MSQVFCLHCEGPVRILDDEYNSDDPYIFYCPHCGKHSEDLPITQDTIKDDK